MSLKATLKRLYHAAVPLAIRRHLRLTRFAAPRRARAHLWRRTGGRVAAGPFKGLRLPGSVPDDCYGAALLGAYECENHDWFERQFSREWTAAVDVGSSEGYYSTGLALRLPHATVHAFEAEAGLRAQTADSARRNGVADRVVVHGTADVQALAALPLTSALVVSDCEGAERELIDPAAVPWLARSALLVELHDFAAPGTTEILQRRFAATHDIFIATQAARDPAEWATRAGITVVDARILLEELRPIDGVHVDSRWMWLTPRAVA